MTTIPLFPLGVVLVPGLVMPLHIFEPRYRLLVSRLQERPADEREFGIVAVTETMGMRSIGTTALLQEVTPWEDGRYDISTTGARRFRILAIDDSEPYLQARVEWLDEPLGDAAEVEAVGVRRLFEAYRECMGSQTEGLPTDPTVLSYLVSAALVQDLPDRQRLLEIEDTGSRLRAEAEFLRTEIAILRSDVPSLPALGLADQSAWSAN